MLAVFFLTLVLISFFITSLIIKKEEQQHIVGRDMNKLGEEVANVGGIAIFLSSFFISLLFLYFKQYVLFAILGSLAILEVFGLLDDFLRIRQVVKAFILGLASLPLIPFTDHFLFIPLIGNVYVGIFFPLFFLPIGFMGASNLVNMLAGYNGLEVMLSLISLSFLTFFCFLNGNAFACALGLAFISILLGFLAHNWYPAKGFPGDSGTLLMGGMICILGVVAGLEGYAALLMLTHLIDFIIKCYNKFPGDTWAKYDDGLLHVPGKVKGLAHLFLNILGPMREDKLVFLISLSHIFICFFVSFVLFL